jgi:hypothetical protein
MNRVASSVTICCAQAHARDVGWGKGQTKLHYWHGKSPMDDLEQLIKLGKETKNHYKGPCGWDEGNKQRLPVQSRYARVRAKRGHFQCDMANYSATSGECGQHEQRHTGSDAEQQQLDRRHYGNRGCASASTLTGECTLDAADARCVALFSCCVRNAGDTGLARPQPRTCGPQKYDRSQPASSDYS